MKKKTQQGFTLIEILLVMVIVGIMLYATVGYLQQRAQSLRIDTTALTMQQILNAGMAYYVATGTWPALTDLTRGNYLPQQPINPWGKNFQIAASTANFYVFTAIPGNNNFPRLTALQIAGMLPNSYTSASSGTPPANTPCPAGTSSCFVVSSVTVPGQNLNNANAVTFAGFYHQGGCIPVPNCPVNTMTAQVIVIPSSLGGYNDPGSPTNAYPLTSFTAFAKGGTNNAPPDCNANSSSYTQGTYPVCTASPIPSTNYWRACVTIQSSKGQVDSQAVRSDWGSKVTLIAFTRCSIQNEPSGTNYSTTIYGN